MRIILLSTLFFIAFSFNKLAAQAPTLSMDTLVTGLPLPMQMVSAGDGTGRFFLVMKAGTVRVYSKAFSLIGTFVTVAGVNSSANERGLLSMVFHPDYKNNGLFYVYYTNTDGNLELARYKVSNNPDIADDASKKILITIPHPVNNNHNGGELHFGKDGYLYLSTGDGGGSNDPNNNAQNTSVLLGKILRFNVNTSDVAPYYTLPPDNKFGNEVFAYGLRNPFRWSFDRLTGDMWIGDVGQDKQEEINFRPADSTNGANYGWRCYEGTANGPNMTGCGPASSYVFPVFTYPTTAANSVSVTGGVVYRGNTFIDLKGYYIAAEYYSGTFFKIKRNGNTQDTSSQRALISFPVDFMENEDGEVYVVSSGTATNGRILRLKASGAVQYKFTGNGNWNVAANWTNNKIPPASLPAGSVIIIDPVADGECVLNIEQNILPGAKLEVIDNKQFRILGNLTIQQDQIGPP